MRRCIALLAVAVALGAAGCESSDSQDLVSGGPPPSSAGGRADADVDWPMFGRVLERTHYIADAPDPPFHYLWEFFAKQLIEFPPVLQDGVLFVVNKTGTVFAIRASNGKPVWKGNLADDVTSPAYDDGTLYLAQLDGTVTALEPRTGKVRWTYEAKTKLESSPLVVRGRVYFGSDDGNLFALDTKTGKLDWSRRLGNDVKASPSFSEGTVYVGDYEGVVWAVDASSGKVDWSTDTTKLPPGGSGGFYSSPAIGFGRVFEARDDGAVYALDLETGKLSWHFLASNSIYSSPAVARVPGTPPTVYIGSYNHQLYALDARSGAKRWRYDVGGVIPGTPTVIGTTVYTSSFQTKKTVGLDTRTGKPVFRWGSAGYTPVISDGRRVFLTGFQTIWAFDAKRPGKGSGGSSGPSGSGG